MIKTYKGSLELHGNITELSADVSVILFGFRKVLLENYGEMADLMFAEVGRIACMAPDEDLLSEENITAVLERAREYKEKHG